MIVICCKIVSTEFPFNMKKWETWLSGTIQDRSHNLWIVIPMFSIRWQRQRSLDRVFTWCHSSVPPKMLHWKHSKYCYPSYSSCHGNIIMDVLITIKANWRYAQDWLYNFAMIKTFHNNSSRKFRLMVAAKFNWYISWIWYSLQNETAFWKHQTQSLCVGLDSCTFVPFSLDLQVCSGPKSGIFESRVWVWRSHDAKWNWWYYILM